MASEETLRLLLQKTIERNDGLVKINHEATLAIPTILGGIWGIIAGINQNSTAILFFAFVTIGILMLWRYVAHNIDDNIAKNYSRILQIEKNLKVSRECSIFEGLIKPIISHIIEEKKRTEYEKNILILCKDQRIKLIQLLYK